MSGIKYESKYVNYHFIYGGGGGCRIWSWWGGGQYYSKGEPIARKNASNNQNIPLFAVLRLISKQNMI